MNEQLKKVETIWNIKKELMEKNSLHDYHVESLNKLNKEIPLLEEELQKELDSMNPDAEIRSLIDDPSASDMLGL